MPRRRERFRRRQGARRQIIVKEMIRLNLPYNSRRHLASPILSAASLAVIAITLAWGAQEQQGAPAPTPAADNKPAEYVGSTTCQGCHEDIFNAFLKNPHQVVE